MRSQKLGGWEIGQGDTYTFGVFAFFVCFAIPFVFLLFYGLVCYCFYWELFS